ncbi:MAG TPA: 1,4-alpha-glucan branching protein GlgB [Gammaproteobacteria bacterium]
MTKTKTEKQADPGAAKDSPTLERGEMDAICAGRHASVFAVLGLHANSSGKGLVLRAFVPGAGKLEVLARNGRKLGELSRVHDGGLFEKIFSNRRKRFDYQLRIDGETCVEDPCRFPGLLQSNDIYLFAEGSSEHAYRWMGAHARRVDGVDGVHFVVWAPSARRVSVVGDFNGWDGRRHVMRVDHGSGIWEIFIPAVGEYAHYKFEIVAANGRLLPLKSDPYARSMQHAPETASRVVLDDSYDWQDDDWMATRAKLDHRQQPISIYEVHAGSWRRKHEYDNRYLSYLELAEELIPYALEMGYTHLELMPISEYPFDGSWGYQPIGLFAPTIRFGTPREFRRFVERCHLAGLGVLLDWVPGHFPTDEHGLGRFDGSCLYEHADPRRGFHPDWNTLIYNYGRNEVRSFLLSNANYWLEEFHIDGLRVDAVASMLYLDYSRQHGEWLPNKHGGRENLEVISLLRDVNRRVHARHPGALMIAEESTAWPGVSEPVYNGGLGFGFKWNLGWMNDSLKHMARDPIHRRYHSNELTFGIHYAWSEKFILPLSHDEVVHGKGSLLGRMPGDEWRQFANLRAYLGFMWAQPGKKLLFMGGEFAQRREWNHDRSLDWHLLKHPLHAGVQRLVRDLNRLYAGVPALHRLDASPEGFEWLQADSSEQSVFAWIRRGGDGEREIVAIANLTPQTHHGYRVGAPRAGRYHERLNTDAADYGGSGQGNLGGVLAEDRGYDGQPASMVVTLPPLATVFFEFAE